MINRYLNRTILENSLEMYREVFLQRNVKYINQYETPTFVYPTEENISSVRIIEHIWSVGDRYYKLANKFYGDPKDWWLIAKFNNKPTESHLQIGDVVLIPLPIERVIEIMR